MTDTYSNIEFSFLPPNTTALSQPLDAGVFYSFKKHYRHRLLQKRLLEPSGSQGPESITLLEAMRLMKDAWNKVTDDTISNCFWKTGFRNTTQGNTCNEDEPFIVGAPDFADFDDF